MNVISPKPGALTVEGNTAHDGAVERWLKLNNDTSENAEKLMIASRVAGS
jgi:hypothetical protein